MASTDWTDLTGGLSSSDVRRGVTGGHTPPSGGGTFVYGMRSEQVVVGAVARMTNQANFAPTPTNKGGSVRGALQRGVSAGSNGFQPFLFIGGQGADVLSNAYLLGLADGESSRIALVKGPVASGIPDVAPGSNGVLRRSTATFAIGTWLHLRLDMRVNANGDTVLTVYRNDLGAQAVSSPVWAAVPGLEQFVDDAIGANSGTVPYTNGRMGYGARFSDVYRRCYFDHLECMRET